MEEGNKDTVKHSSCDPQFELEKQLHEQYAINNNAHIGSFITFLIALLSLFGSFGYVYVHSSTDSTKCGIITLDVFFLFSIVVAGMLFFLSLISLQLGYSNRSNQIVINRIRDKYFKENKKEIFGIGKSYSPLEKNCWDFIQGFFNSFYWLFFVGQIFVLILTIFKHKIISSDLNCSWTFFLCFIYLVQFGLIVSTLRYREIYFEKYNTNIKTNHQKKQ